MYRKPQTLSFPRGQAACSRGGGERRRGGRSGSRGRAGAQGRRAGRALPGSAEGRPRGEERPRPGWGGRLSPDGAGTAPGWALFALSLPRPHRSSRSIYSEGRCGAAQLARCLSPPISRDRPP